MKMIIQLIFFLLPVFAFAQQANIIITGTYTSDTSRGIYIHRFDTASQQIRLLSITEATNPSYLALGPESNFIYSVNVKGPQDSVGRISAYRFDQTNGKLTLLNSQQSPGDNPCYISVHPSGRWVAVGNYDNATVGIFPVQPDGSLLPFAVSRKHTGAGKDSIRQKEAHVHATVFSTDGRFLYVPDLGMDKIMIYQFNHQTGALTAGNPAFVSTRPGSGPRHLEFNPTSTFAYLVQELSGEVTVFKVDKKSGGLRPVQTITTTPGFTGVVASADIHLSPDGRYLYASNRGESNTISVFAVEQKTGRLSFVAMTPVLGKTPRNFCISGDGKYILVANQNSDEVVIFSRNATSGLLTDTRLRMQISKPVCLKMPR